MYSYQFFNKQRITELYEKEELEGEITEEEMKERMHLWEEGFSSWTKGDFNSFIKASEKHGRNAIDEIAESLKGKSKEEVTRYHRVFWSRYKELKDGEKIVSSIEKAEKKLAKNKETNALIEEVLSKFPNSVEDLHFNYGPHYQAKGFSRQADRYILACCRKYGYGNWLRVKQALDKIPQLKFDYFLRTRTPVELSRRAEVLAKLLQRTHSYSSLYG